MSEPQHGYTNAGAPVHGLASDHLPTGSAYARFNKRVAVAITGFVGSMTCAYVFGGIALISFPAALASGSTIILVSWVAQTFLQLVLLSIIIVGQNISSAASDARAAKTFDDAEIIADRLNIETEGGITEILNVLAKHGMSA